MKKKLIISSLLLLVAAIYLYFSSYASTFIGINELSKEGNLMTNDVDTAFSELNVSSFLDSDSDSDSDSSEDILKSFEKATDSAKGFTISTINFGYFYLIGLILSPILIYLMRILIIWYRNNNQTRRY